MELYGTCGFGDLCAGICEGIPGFLSGNQERKQRMTKENAIGILLSARDEYQTAEGWVKVGDITIQ